MFAPRWSCGGEWRRLLCSPPPPPPLTSHPSLWTLSAFGGSRKRMLVSDGVGMRSWSSSERRNPDSLDEKSDPIPIGGRCGGCGTPFQQNRVDLPGFLPLHLIHSEICERCFRLRNYGSPRPKGELGVSRRDVTLSKEYLVRFERPSVGPNELRSRLQSILDTHQDTGVVFLMTVDVADIEGSWMDLSKIARPRRDIVIVAATKIDVLPNLCLREGTKYVFSDEKSRYSALLGTGERKGARVHASSEKDLYLERWLHRRFEDLNTERPNDLCDEESRASLFQNQKQSDSNDSFVSRIVPVSVRSGHGVSELVGALRAARRKLSRNESESVPIVVIGCTNTGKSSVVSTLIKHVYKQVESFRSLSTDDTSAKSDVNPLQVLSDVDPITEVWTKENREHSILVDQNVSPSIIRSLFRKVHQPSVPKSIIIPTVSSMPSTTLDVLRFTLPSSFDKKSSRTLSSGLLYDTPGLEREIRIEKYVPVEMAMDLCPSLRYFPRCFTMYPGRNLVIGDALIDVRISPEKAEQNDCSHPRKPFVIAVVYCPKSIPSVASQHFAPSKHSSAVNYGTQPSFDDSISKSRSFEVEGRDIYSKHGSCRYILPLCAAPRTCSHDLVISGVGWISFCFPRMGRSRNAEDEHVVVEADIWFPKAYADSVLPATIDFSSLFSWRQSLTPFALHGVGESSIQ